MASGQSKNVKAACSHLPAASQSSNLSSKLDQLAALETGVYDKDFLLTWQYRDETIRGVLLAAEILEDLAAAGVSTRVFDTGLGISIFRDKSTRTRYAFRSGCNLLGLMTEELDESTSQIAHGETVRETAAMISLPHGGDRHPRRHVPGRGPQVHDRR